MLATTQREVRNKKVSNKNYLSCLILRKNPRYNITERSFARFSEQDTFGTKGTKIAKQGPVEPVLLL